MIELEVTGQAEIRRVAARMRAEDAAFDKNLVAGIRRAVAPLGTAIKAGVPNYMPSGYAPVLGAALSTTTSVRQVRGPGVSVRVSAKGRSRPRHVRALDAGLLRHKLFGNPNFWYSQRIRAGFVTDKFKAMRDPVVASMRQVIENVVERIAR